MSRPRKLIRKRGKRVGAAPGTLVHVGEQHQAPSQLRCIRYDANHIEDKRPQHPQQCHQQISAGCQHWINLDGVQDVNMVRQLGNLFDLHPLVQEDILNTDHRPKIEIHEHYVYVVLKMLQYNSERDEIVAEQVSLVLGQHYLLSLQERPGDVFDAVRERLFRSGKRIRESGCDYLAYALVDAIVDHYFVLLEQIADQIELLEAQLLEHPDRACLARIHHFRREMLMLRKAVWPLREVLSTLTRDESVLIDSRTQPFLRDVYDHCIHIMDTVETLRELLTGMLDLYLSSVSHRMNEIMKVLTIFASIFMPLTFVAGIYGMNFEYMPELSRPWAYPATLTGMAVIAVGLILFFRWRRWL